MQEKQEFGVMWSSAGIAALMLVMIILSWGTVYLIVSSVIENAAASLVTIQP